MFFLSEKKAEQAQRLLAQRGAALVEDGTKPGDTLSVQRKVRLDYLWCIPETEARCNCLCADAEPFPMLTVKGRILGAAERVVSFKLYVLCMC